MFLSFSSDPAEDNENFFPKFDEQRAIEEFNLFYPEHILPTDSVFAWIMDLQMKM